MTGLGWDFCCCCCFYIWSELVHKIPENVKFYTGFLPFFLNDYIYHMYINTLTTLWTDKILKLFQNLKWGNSLNQFY